MFLVTNIDQMYKEMKKIVEVGNKHRNGDEFPFPTSTIFFISLYIWSMFVTKNIVLHVK
jgi:hypothetical protein